jgi:hypothetical protein
MHIALHVYALELMRNQLLEDSEKKKNYLQNADLRHPDHSPWHHLYRYGSDAALEPGKPLIGY